LLAGEFPEGSSIIVDESDGDMTFTLDDSPGGGTSDSAEVEVLAQEERVEVENLAP
jgi:hypothetical protein